MPVKRNDNLDEAETAILAAFSTGLYEAGKAEKRNVEKNWDRGRDALGRLWTELAPSTIRNKGHDSILIKTGDMRDSVFVERDGPLSITLGVADGKINYHEFGTETIPPRPVVRPAMTHLRAGVLQSELARRIGRAILAVQLKSALRL